MKTFAAILLACHFAYAQRISFGALVGVPLTNGFDPSNGTEAYPASGGFRTYSGHKSAFAAGLTVEFRLRSRLSIELDALYQRPKFDGYDVQYTTLMPTQIGARGFAVSTSAGIWDFPLQIKYRIGDRALRPYLGTGGAVSRVTSVRQSIACFDFVGPCKFNGITLDESVDVRRRTVFGAIAAAGVEIAIPATRMRVSPEFRYVHYGARQIIGRGGGLIRSSKDRALFLLGITF